MHDGYVITSKSKRKPFLSQVTTRVFEFPHFNHLSQLVTLIPKHVQLCLLLFHLQCTRGENTRGTWKLYVLYKGYHGSYIQFPIQHVFPQVVIYRFGKRSRFPPHHKQDSSSNSYLLAFAVQITTSLPTKFNPPGSSPRSHSATKALALSSS